MTDQPIALRIPLIDMEAMIRVRTACDWLKSHYDGGWSYGGYGVFSFWDHTMAVAFRLANPELILKEVEYGVNKSGE